jgi:hypothetical protein
VTPDGPYGKIAGLMRARHLIGLKAFSEGGYERRRGMMRKLILGIALAMPLAADASCMCSCVNGQPSPICQYKSEKLPVCSPQTCPPPPQLIGPVRPPKGLASGATNCYKVQVWNAAHDQYVWRMICG